MKTRILFLLILITACAPGGPHKPVEGEGQEGAVTYDQVRPIFAMICAACHPARSGPNWLDYNEAKNFVQNGRLFERVVSQKSMPPPGSPQAAAMTERERRLIGLWVKSGGLQAGEQFGDQAKTETAGEIPKIVAITCRSCHGAGNQVTQAKVPRLNGQSQSYLRTQLNRYKWRSRIDPSDTMNNVALSLSEEEIDASAKFYSSLKGPLGSSRVTELKNGDKALFDKGRVFAEGYCVMCHMSPEMGNKPIDPSIPVLAGQVHDYLTNQLIFFRADERLSPVMHEQARALSNSDIEALTLYFSSIQP